MSASSWQQAWEQAQPRLHAIRNLSANFPRARARVLRVGQLDAELLDQELLQMLTAPLSKALGLIQSSYRSRFEPELTLLVHLILYKLSIWDLGTTYGAKLQNLRYRNMGTTASRSLAPSGLPQCKLWYHASITILAPYLHTRLRIYALSRAWADAPSSNPKRKAWETLAHVEAVHNVLSVASFIAFLYDGRYRTWADRLLGFQLIPSQRSSTREVSYEFMNRQMVWHAFTEFLLFLLPLINTRILRRRIVRTLGQFSLSKFVPSDINLTRGDPAVGEACEKTTSQQGKYWMLSEDQCAICAEDSSFDLTDSRHDIYSANLVAATSSITATDGPPRYPINTPYVSSCGHVYCYVCLSERMLRAADDGEPAWECLRCEATVRSAHRVGVVHGILSSCDDLEMDEDSIQNEDLVPLLQASR